MRGISQVFNVIPYIKNLDQIKIIGMSQLTTVKVYEKDQIIVEEESTFDRIYIIKNGRVKLTKNNKNIKKLYDSEKRNSWAGRYQDQKERLLLNVRVP